MGMWVYPFIMSEYGYHNMILILVGYVPMITDTPVLTPLSLRI